MTDREYEATVKSLTSNVEAGMRDAATSAKLGVVPRTLLIPLWPIIISSLISVLATAAIRAILRYLAKMTVGDVAALIAKYRADEQASGQVD